MILKTFVIINVRLATIVSDHKKKDFVISPRRKQTINFASKGNI